MKNTINRILALYCGLILIGCNSGGSSVGSGGSSVNSTVQILGPINDSTGVSFNSNDVALNSIVTLKFSEPVKGVSPSTLTWSSDSSSVPFNIESGANNTYKLSLQSGAFLEPDTVYNVQVKNGITGNVTSSGVPPATFSFITAKPPRPTASLTSPTTTTNVSITPTFTITFSESLFGVTNKSIQVQNLSGTPESAIIIKSGNSYTFQLNQPLLYTTGYVVRVKNGIRSLATSVSVLPTQFNFTTTPPPPPTATLTSPTPTTSITTPITLTFNEAVTGVNTTSIQFESKGGNPQSITITPNGNIYTLTPSASLVTGTDYVVLVNSGISSIATGAQVLPTQFNFTTATQPTVNLTSPTPTTNVSVNPTITLTFNEAVTNVNTNTIQLQTQSGTPQIITIIESGGNRYNLVPTSALLYGTQYVVIVNSGISSLLAGVAVAPIQFNFTTAVQPTVSLTSPSPTTNVSISPTITLTFSEAVSNVNTTTIQFQTQGGLPQDFTITPNGNIYTLKLSGVLLSETRYLVIVNTGIISVATSAAVAPITFNFTTRTGLLTPLGTVTTGPTPVGISISPDGANVYIINQGNNTVSQFSRNGSGILTPIGTPIATPTRPTAISISPDGKNVYIITTINTNIVSQYSRNPDGTLTALGTVATGPTPVGISISPDGANVYVTNIVNSTISEYSRSASGRLAVIGTVAVGAAQAYDMTISPDGANVYVTTQSCIVAQYSRNGSGILTAIGTIATGNNPQGISISSDGFNVYVADRDSDTVSQYSRNGSGDRGILTALGTIATGVRPQGVSISPDGLNVYVTNGGSATISQYSR